MHDLIMERLKASRDENYKSLDLSNLNIKKIPNISNVFKQNVKYLFLNNNKLENVDVIKDFNLITLDISFNNIKKINILPLSLTELCCQYNDLLYIPSHNNIEKLDCSHNNISSISNFPKLTHLVCDEETKIYNCLKIQFRD